VLTNKLFGQKSAMYSGLCKACPTFQIECLAFVHLWNNALSKHVLPVACLNMCIYVLEYEKKLIMHYSSP